jgi:MFS family permease
LTMIIISDIVSLKERGKYQGMLGSAIAVGGGLGPLLGGIFAQSASWRWYVLLKNNSNPQGLLVLSPHLSPRPYPTMVLPSSRQGFREYEIETQKDRLRRQSYFASCHDLCSRFGQRGRREVCLE